MGFGENYMKSFYLCATGVFVIQLMVFVSGVQFGLTYAYPFIRMKMLESQLSSVYVPVPALAAPVEPEAQEPTANSILEPVDAEKEGENE